VTTRSLLSESQRQERPWPAATESATRFGGAPAEWTGSSSSLRETPPTAHAP
jgi:hypothetical protein